MPSQAIAARPGTVLRWPPPGPALDRDPRQIRFKSERGKLFGGMWKQIDADPDRPDFGRRFKYPAGNPGGVQREPQRQSADAGPDNNDVVHVCSRRALSGDCRNETRLVRPLSIWLPRRRKRYFLAISDKAHPGSGGLVDHLAREPLGTAP